MLEREIVAVKSPKEAVQRVLRLPCMAKKSSNITTGAGGAGDTSTATTRGTAVVFDIDDTLCSRCPHTGREIPIKPVVALYQECVRRNIEPLVVTARSYASACTPADKMPPHLMSPEEHVREVYMLFTRLNLPLPRHLALRPHDADDYSPTGIARTKRALRDYLAARSGCQIIGTVGDRCWDHTLYEDTLERRCARAYRDRRSSVGGRGRARGGGMASAGDETTTTSTTQRDLCYVGVGRSGRFVLKLPEQD